MNNYQLILPINTEILIPENDSVRLLNEILEDLNYKNLNSKFSQLGRKPALEPKMFF